MKEFDLLVELIQNKNIALYRDRLYEKIWNEPYMGDTRTLDTHIQRLRKNWAGRIISGPCSGSGTVWRARLHEAWDETVLFGNDIL